jgi:hypothetical protein
VRLVSGSGLTKTQADLLAERCAALDGDALIALAELLRDVHTWPLSHPDLARRLLEEARQLGPDTADAVRVAVRRGMSLTTWTSVDGVSSELDAARADASRRASSEIDPELRADFERQRALIEATIADLAREEEEDDEG